ncbi:hypothetical protein ACWGLF_07125 [Streptomyces puniciscabiei]
MNSSRTPEKNTAERVERARRTRTARGPWAVLCAVATVVIGPAAATASALDQANAAPLHQAVRAGQPQACLPADGLRRRTAG